MRFLLGSTVLILLSGSVVAKPFIIGGQSPDAEPLVLKSTVSLITNYRGEIRSFCTGTVINSITVVTAAHCIAGHDDADIFIAHGEDALKSEMIKAVKFKYLHAGYHTNWSIGEFGSKDIAILIAESALPLDSVKIGNPLEVELKTPLILAGYGVTSTAADDGTDPMLDTGILHTLFASTFDKLEKTKVTVNEKSDMRVAGGDSGGPIYIKKDGKFTLHGVLSNGGTVTEIPEVVNGVVPSHHFAEYTHPAFFVEWMNCALPEDQKLEIQGLPAGQIPCDGTELKEMKDLASFNKEICEKQRPGFSTVLDMGCFPVTQKACEEYSQETQPTVWDEATKECSYIEDLP